VFDTRKINGFERLKFFKGRGPDAVTSSQAMAAGSSSDSRA
jgi:hypothetical protein